MADEESIGRGAPQDTAGSALRLQNRLRMRQVALLLAIDEQRTLRGAAEALGMTQPAATKMLHELEDALGQPLFERAGRGLRPTAAGLCATGYFRGLRGTMESMTQELQQIRHGGVGRLRIGSIMAASPGPLTAALIALKQEMPMLAIEIDTGTSDRLMEHLDEGTLDLAIGRLPRQAVAGYRFRPLAEEALSVVAATDHPLAARRRVAFDELRAFSWILQPSGSPMREVIEQEFAAHHTPLPRGLIESASILTTTNLIARTRMVAVIPESIASRYAQHGLLAVLPYRLQHQLASYGSIVRQDRPASLAARRFLDLLHAQAPEAAEPAVAAEDAAADDTRGRAGAR